jgi:hypothetical protein
LVRQDCRVSDFAWTALSILLAASCATATRQRVYVAPSYETIVADPEASYDGIHQQIYIFNHSTVPVVITSFHLTDCENVANRCELKRLRILINPNQRMLVATIGPEDRDRAYNFRYSWTWDTVK